MGMLEEVRRLGMYEEIGHFILVVEVVKVVGWSDPSF